ncbi:RidA family protein [Komagataeibacter sp. NFXK3]
MKTCTNISRTAPDIGYLDADIFGAMGFSQSVKFGNMVHYAGVAPLRGGLKNLQIISEDDMAGQIEFVLATLDACLKADGLTREHLLSWTIYTTDIAELSAHAALLAKWVGPNRPASTIVEVSALFLPKQKLEITVFAAVPQGVCASGSVTP